jgi:hypothetical protein
MSEFVLENGFGQGSFPEQPAATRSLTAIWQQSFGGDFFEPPSRRGRRGGFAREERRFQSEECPRRAVNGAFVLRCLLNPNHFLGAFWRSERLGGLCDSAALLFDT